MISRPNIKSAIIAVIYSVHLHYEGHIIRVEPVKTTDGWCTHSEITCSDCASNKRSQCRAAEHSTNVAAITIH